MSKKYFVLVVCCLMAIGILGSCTVAAPSSNNGGGGGESTPLNPFNLASCYRIYGDEDCRMAATSVAMGDIIGVVVAQGATGFSITSGNDNGNFTISSAGVLTAAKAISSIDATFSQELTISTPGSTPATRTITVTNDVAKATMGMPEVGDIAAASPQNGDDMTLVNATVAGKTGFSSTYTGDWGGWLARLTGDPIDLRPYRTVYIRYNLASGSTGFEFKMESAGVRRGGYMLNGMGGRPSITADGMWQTVEFPLMNLMGLKNGSGGAVGDASHTDPDAGLNLAAITIPISFFNQGRNIRLIIDEVYIR